MRLSAALLMVLALAGCADQLYADLPDYMQAKKLSDVSMKNFPHCQNYGCAVVKKVELNQKDWKQIERAFGPKAKSAEQEREKIAKTIGEFERVVGPITGTEHDREGTFLETGDGQLDCVDESSNTTVYMLMLKDAGLIRFHDIDQPQVRYPLLSGRGWMHQTAVVTETKTGAQYAIDSWYEDNGVAAYVVPLIEWRNGWHPRPN
jgi:hypothetical protein